MKKEKENERMVDIVPWVEQTSKNYIKLQML